MSGEAKRGGANRKLSAGLKQQEALEETGCVSGAVTAVNDRQSGRKLHLRMDLNILFRASPEFWIKNRFGQHPPGGAERLEDKAGTVDCEPVGNQ
jgi:hypothetical protein